MTRFFNLTPGLDDLTGLPGDYNAFQLAPTTLQSTDTVTGGSTGGFFDLILLTAGGTILGAAIRRRIQPRADQPCECGE